MTLAFELIFEIASYLVANGERPVPQLYLQLAMVSRDFYAVFMSDILWAKLNVYGLKQDIASHYLERKAAMSPREREFCGNFNWRCWRHPVVEAPQFEEFDLYTQAMVMAEQEQVDAKFRSDLQGRVHTAAAIKYAARTRTGLWFAHKELLLQEPFFSEVASCGLLVRYLPAHLASSKELVLKALRHFDYDALEFCAEELKDDKQVVLASVERWGRGLEFASKDLQNDREVALAAVEVDGSQLRWCSPNLRRSYHVVLKAVQQCGLALEFAPDLSSDERVVTAALRQNVRAFEFVGGSLRSEIVKRGFAKLK